jgi:Zn-dependent protease/CBS domain-containing protein
MSERGQLTGLPIARLYGIRIRIHASWLVIFLLFAYLLATQFLPLSNLVHGGWWGNGVAVLDAFAKSHGLHGQLNPATVAQELGIGWPEWQYWVLGVIGSLGLFVCVLAHEISHSLVARGHGIEVEDITLFLLGGVSQLKEESAAPGVEFKVAAAGPLMSIFLGLGTWALYWALGDQFPEQARALLIFFIFINLMLAVFNLLPGYPLDGGRLLRAILWKRYQDMNRATVAAAKWGRAIGMGFIVWGFWALWITWENTGQIDLLGPPWMILIGWFLRQAAKASVQQITVRDTFSGLTVGDVIRPEVVTVEPDLTLDRLVDEYFYRYRFRSFPVLEDGRLVGMVSLKDLQAVPRSDWPARRVRDAMHQVGEENLVHPTDDLASIFQKMAQADKGHLPVVEDGRLVGIVTRHDIMTLIQLKTDFGGHVQPPGR